MKKFYMIVNKARPAAPGFGERVVRYLRKNGCEVNMPSDATPGEISGGDGPRTGYYTAPWMIPEGTECIIVIGGDGTMLQAARDLAGTNIPLFGINAGHMGYLTQIADPEEIEPALEDLIADRYLIEYCMMLDGEVVRGDRKYVRGEYKPVGGEVFAREIAMNDVIINRSGMKPIRFDLYLDGTFINDYDADGIIIATPTGSTAYNMSAGGPILEPGGSMIVMTPVCPHTMNSRSIVVSAQSVVSVVIASGFPGRQCVSFDGGTVVGLVPGDRVDIRRSEIRVPVIELEHVPFMEQIRRKMRII